MVDNLTLGPVQVFSLDVSSLNAAFSELHERMDALKGLRGRASIFDRARVDSPTVDTDAVDLQSLVTQEFRWHLSFLFMQTVADAPGTTYTELGTAYRMPIDFTQLTSPKARMIVSGFGLESGTGKGVAMTTSTGTVICEVTFDGQTEAVRSGDFTAITETTDQQVQIRVKGSSATESLVLRSVAVEFKGTIQTVST